MRAQGIASGKIIASIFWQIFILSTLGISLAVLALLGTQLVLPASMPFYSDWRAYLILYLKEMFVQILNVQDNLDLGAKH